MSINKSKFKETMLNTTKGFLIILKWLLIGIVMGLIVGAISSAFSFCLSYVTEIRTEYPYIVYGLPIGGIVIVGLYRLIPKEKDVGTDGIIEAISENPRFHP